MLNDFYAIGQMIKEKIGVTRGDSAFYHCHKGDDFKN